MSGPPDERYFREAADIEFAPDLPLLTTEQIAEALAEPEPAGEAVEFVSFEEFVASPEPQAEPLATDAEGGTAIPASGLGMVYGSGGAGKTTLVLDAAAHLAAGEPWLEGHVQPVRKLRIAWIENEGPREEFRRKAERKLEAWQGRIPPGQLRILNRPWGQYDLRRAEHREALGLELGKADIDLLIFGPLHRLGFEGGGTPDDIRGFSALLEGALAGAGRPCAVLIIHHENRAGQVSGAWEGVPDLLVHVQGQGHGRLRVHWQKARWSSALHATGLNLTWAEGEGFAVEDKPELDDDAIAEQILAAVEAEPGGGWTRVEEQTPGMAKARRRAVRDRLLRAGHIANVVKGEGGELERLDYCPERRQARLYLGDDPTNRHLRPGPGADGAQIAPPGGEGATAHLRPAPRPIGGAGVAAQLDPPRSASAVLPRQARTTPASRAAARGRAGERQALTGTAARDAGRPAHSLGSARARPPARGRRCGLPGIANGAPAWLLAGNGARRGLPRIRGRAHLQ